MGWHGHLLRWHGRFSGGSQSQWMDGWIDAYTTLGVCVLRGMPHPLQGLSVKLACTRRCARSVASGSAHPPRERVPNQGKSGCHQVLIPGPLLREAHALPDGSSSQSQWWAEMHVGHAARPSQRARYPFPDLCLARCQDASCSGHPGGCSASGCRLTGMHQGSAASRPTPPWAGCSQQSGKASAHARSCNCQAAAGGVACCTLSLAAYKNAAGKSAGRDPASLGLCGHNKHCFPGSTWKTRQPAMLDSLLST